MTTKFIGQGTGKRIRNRTLSDFNFSISSAPTTTATNSAIITTQINDIFWYQNSSTTLTTTGQIVTKYTPTGNIYPITLINKSPGIATLNSDGTLSFISTGIATIWAKALNATLAINIPCFQTTGTTANVFSNYASGTLGAHSKSQIETAITGKLPSIAWKMFSAENAGINYTRNVSAWTSSIDLTCVSPWNSDSGPLKAGILITPQDILFARHYSINIGSIFQFVDNSNIIHIATLIGSQQVGSTDIMVGHLDVAMPGSITPCKIFPSNYAHYLPSIGLNTNLPLNFGNPYSVNVPVLVLNQYKQLLIADWSLMSSGTATFYGPAVNESNRIDWFPSNGIISGDSGNPFFLIINGSLVLVSCLFNGGVSAGGGPCTGDNVSGINTALSSLGSSYTTTTVNLSGFTSY